MKHVDLMALRSRKVVGNKRTLGALTCLVRPLRATSRGGQHHGASVQPRLAYCPAWGEFRDLWRRSRTEWTHYACQWRTTATSHELWLCAKLLIPPSLINGIPKTDKTHKLRAEIGLFQFRMIHAVETLRWKLADPTPQQPPSPLWLTKFTAQPLPPREPARNLRDQVVAPLRYLARNRKRKAKTTTPMPVDAQLWLQVAHAANDGEAVTWLTSIHRTHKQTHEEHTSKRRRLDNLTIWWEHDLSCSNKLALQHTQRACEMYRFAQVTETALLHLRERHTMYTNILTAKMDYHLLVTDLLKERIETQRLHNAYTATCLECRQWNDQTKNDTMRHYADRKTSLLSYERFKRLRIDTDVLLTHHPQQALYTLLQQEHIIQLAHETANSHRIKTTMYWDSLFECLFFQSHVPLPLPGDHAPSS